MRACAPPVKSFILTAMELSPSKEKRRPGRPLSFDREKALNKAMHQFWSTGYETTSVADLTAAMGITAPSLYTAFGDKESLFLECVRLYTQPGLEALSARIGQAASARSAAENLLNIAAQTFTQPNAPAGCLVASAASSGSETSERVRNALKNVRETTRLALQKRADDDAREGRLARGTTPKALVNMTMAILHGMSTLARDGADRQSLQELARAAMAAWPEDRLQ